MKKKVRRHSVNQHTRTHTCLYQVYVKREMSWKCKCRTCNYVPIRESGIVHFAGSQENSGSSLSTVHLYREFISGEICKCGHTQLEHLFGCNMMFSPCEKCDCKDWRKNDNRN